MSAGDPFWWLAAEPWMFPGCDPTLEGSPGNPVRGYSDEKRAQARRAGVASALGELRGKSARGRLSAQQDRYRAAGALRTLACKVRPSRDKDDHKNRLLQLAVCLERDAPLREADRAVVTGALRTLEDQRPDSLFPRRDGRPAANEKYRRIAYEAAILSRFGYKNPNGRSSENIVNEELSFRWNLSTSVIRDARARYEFAVDAWAQDGFQEHNILWHSRIG